MKRKDDLLRLAFGELADDAARAVEAGADVSDRREIEAFRALRQGLQHLPPPPPDGLSAERLRAAILDRELRARPRPFAWGSALLMPVAVAALAAVVLLPRLRPRSEAQLVIGDNVPMESLKVPAFEPVAPIREALRAPVATAKAVPAPRPEIKEARGDARLARRRAPRSTAPPEEPTPYADTWVSMPPASVGADEAPRATYAVAKRDPQTIATPPSSLVEHAPGKGGETETVVIVSSQRDLETGALAATEKEVSSVLVGG